MQLQEYELIAITETLWDSSHNWNAVMEGYMLFLGKTVQEGGVALNVRKQLECIEFCLGVDEECLESLWVRIKSAPCHG